jgi:glycosyltransferase involved in cell wall biosynthesis
VVDDGSTDTTPELLAQYGEDIVVVSQANCGLSAARNAGVRASTGDVVGLLDGDDRWAPDRVAECVGLLQGHQGLGFVTSDALIIDESGAPTGDHFFQGDRTFPESGFAARIVRRNFMFVGAVFWRSLYDDLGGFDEGLRSVEDYDMWLRLIAHGAEPGIVDAPLAEYRVRTDSLTSNTTAIQESRLAVLEARLPEYWRFGIYGHGYDAWAIGESLLRRNDRKQALRFFLAAAQDSEKPRQARAKTGLKGLLRTLSTRITD